MSRIGWSITFLIHVDAFDDVKSAFGEAAIRLSSTSRRAGPDNLRKFRAFARQTGLDPNIWFNNVELDPAKVLGLGPVQYVSNISKYYIPYQLSVERLEAHRKAD
jgi:membrane-bound lytic murein transglycosylase MltF